MEDLKRSFVAAASAAFPEAEMPRIESALAYLVELKTGLFRASGEPAWEHNLRVAGTLIEMGLDGDSILAGLLHDTLEETLGAARDGSEAAEERRRAESPARPSARAGRRETLASRRNGSPSVSARRSPSSSRTCRGSPP